MATATAARLTIVQPPARPTAEELPVLLAVRRLRLVDFRNHKAAALTLDTRPVVLSGPNGAGKTNLLEAVSLLAPGRGLRRARLAELDRQGGGPWSLAATITTRDGPVEIKTGREPSSARRAVAIEGSTRHGTAELAQTVAAIWLTPAHDRLFNDSPAARRRFLDRLVLTLEPEHGARLAAYERALRERSLLLRDRLPDADWLRAVERRTAELAIAVAAARLDHVQALGAVLARTQGPFPVPRLAVVGELEGWLAREPALAAEDRLADALARARAQDAATGGAAHGPHRSDLDAVDDATGTPARDCSTGRQKALLLAIVLAEARLRQERVGELPLVLLDEVAAHLDARHREELLTSLTALGAQTWLSGTDASTFASLGRAAQHLHVHDGLIEPR